MFANNKNAKLLRKYSVDFVPEQDQTKQNCFVCNTCNSTHIIQDGKVSTRCPSCGNTSLAKCNFNASIPDGIIPFAMEKKEAVQIFEKWLKKRKFAPNDLITLAKNGKISKVYVPVYNINGVSICHYNGTVKKVHTDGSTNTIYSTVHTIKNVETDNIENECLSANKVIDNRLIEKIIKVNPSQIVPFSNQYLLDYYAVNTDVTIHEKLNNYIEDLKDFTENDLRIRLKQKYDEIVNLNCDTTLKNVSFNYCYVPVFMNHFTYKNKDYHCYISGINGKVAGKTPKSTGKILALLGFIFAAIGAGIWALLTFL